MSRRTQPFPGFSRGVPVERKPEPQAQPAPPGRYHYHIPMLVQHRGRTVQAEALSVHFPAPMHGDAYIAIVQRYQAQNYAAPVGWWARLLVALRLRDGMPALVPLAPYYLGFVPDAPAAEMEEKPEAAA